MSPRRLAVALGLAVGLLSPLPARGDQQSGPADCGVLAVGGVTFSDTLISPDNPESLVGVFLEVPCPGVVTARAVMEIESADPLDIEIRASLLFGCLQSTVSVAGAGPGCVVGSVTTLAPGPATIPVPSSINGQVVGLTTVSVTASGTLDRGTYFGLIRVEPIGGILSVPQYSVHVLSGGPWTPLSGR